MSRHSLPFSAHRPVPGVRQEIKMEVQSFSMSSSGRPPRPPHRVCRDRRHLSSPEQAPFRDPGYQHSEAVPPSGTDVAIEGTGATLPGLTPFCTLTPIRWLSLTLPSERPRHGTQVRTVEPQGARGPGPNQLPSPGRWSARSAMCGDSTRAAVSRHRRRGSSTPCWPLLTRSAAGCVA